MAEEGEWEEAPAAASSSRGSNIVFFFVFVSFFPFLFGPIKTQRNAQHFPVSNAQTQTHNDSIATKQQQH